MLKQKKLLLSSISGYNFMKVVVMPLEKESITKNIRREKTTKIVFVVDMILCLENRKCIGKTFGSNKSSAIIRLRTKL